MKKKRKIISILLLILCVLPAGLFLLAWGMPRLGRRSMMGRAVYDAQPLQEAIAQVENIQEELSYEEGVVVYQGERYRYNEEIITILCMGIDTNETVEVKDVAGTSGQADTIFLLVLDPKSEQMRLLGISRDTMTDIELYDLNGRYMGTDRNHLALAYAYGDGAQKSCELVQKAVSNLFFQMPIHGYCSINIHAISALNDLVGGVTVTVEDEDLVSCGFQPGTTVTLDGKQAETYIRYRPNREAVSNGRRMERQKKYAYQYVVQAKAELADNLLLPVQAVKEIAPYLVTDLDISEISYLATIAAGMKFALEDIQMVEGLEVTAAYHDEFYASDSRLFEMILEVFYEKEE